MHSDQKRHMKLPYLCHVNAVSSQGQALSFGKVHLNVSDVVGYIILSLSNNRLHEWRTSVKVEVTLGKETFN